MPKKSVSKKSWVIARTDDGTVQITYTIDAEQISSATDLVVADYAKSATIPGFRKGKAPLSKVRPAIAREELIEKVLSRILPKLLGDTINSEKLNLALYPKFELIKTPEGEDWEVKAVTCELPEVKLGDYKKVVSGELRSRSLKKQLSHEEKEQIAVDTLLKTTNIKIPKILTEEEVNSRLAKLLERLEKLGIQLDQYLKSINKKPEELRNEYTTQASGAIQLELALMDIASKNNLVVDDKEIAETIKAQSADPQMAERLNSPEQKNAIKNVLLKRKALELLIHSS